MQDQILHKECQTIELPPIPNKRYFTIGEASDLCGVKPHVLRYWEQEFQQLSPCKRRGNRRYYQYKDVVAIRQIRELLYEKGFTIIGARKFLTQQKRTAKPTALQPVIQSLESVLNLLVDNRDTTTII